MIQKEKVVVIKVESEFEIDLGGKRTCWLVGYKNGKAGGVDDWGYNGWLCHSVR